MPARKPKALITRHETKAEIRQREDRESSMRPEQELPRGAPARLAGHKVAGETWRRLIRLYSETKDPIVSKLDQDLLVDYCILMEQLVEMDLMRKSAADIHQLILSRIAAIEKKRAELKKRIAEAEISFELAQELDGLKAQDEALEEKQLDLALRLTNAFDTILKLDARVDLKRAKIHTLRQSLYLTPRARAGVAPEKKEKPEEPDEMEKLLNEAGIFVGDEK